MVLPREPDFVPPKCFVPNTGIKKSKTVITKAITPITINVVSEISESEIKNINNRAIKLNGGPGKTGAMEPIIPTMAQIMANTINNVFMGY